MWVDYGGPLSTVYNEEKIRIIIFVVVVVVSVVVTVIYISVHKGVFCHSQQCFTHSLSKLKVDPLLVFKSWWRC